MTAPAPNSGGIVRFSGDFLCPACGGHEALPRKKGVRCTGYLGSSGQYFQCSREEYAGSIAPSRSGLYPHLVEGPCNCGATHKEAVGRSIRPAQQPTKRRTTGPSIHPNREQLKRAAEFSADGKPVVAEYEYQAGDGSLRLIVFRIDLGDGDKTFRQGRPEGNGFVLSSKGADLVPFHLPELLAAIPAGDTVYIVEGEKDVLAVEDAGFPATCNPMGAGKDLASYAKHFEGAAVVRVVADRDKVGRKHAHAWADLLRPIAKRVEIVEPAEGKDAYDSLVTHGLSIENALVVVETRNQSDDSMSKGTDKSAPTRRVEEHLTDLGNARRLVRLHGRDIRYVHTFRRWLAWDGIQWADDSNGEVMRRAKSVPRDLYRAAGDAPDKDRRDRLAKYAHRTESEKGLKALISLAKSEESIPASPDDFNPDPWVLNTPKGLVDLRSTEISPHSREAMCTRMTGAGFDPGARSDLWESCLETWIPDIELRGFVKRAVGYSLIGKILEQVILIMWGAGANGKSVFIEIIRAALGDYALNTPAETLISSRGGGIPNDVARLKGARFVSASESDENRNLAEAKVKALTGGDKITARFMRAEFFEFTPTFTIWLSTNHKPVIRGNDLGIWRRIKLIPFTVTIPESDRDPKLLQRLEAELPAVVAWAVEGCREYQERGLDAPEAVMAATDAYRRESDVFGDFLDERCIVGPDRFASADALYSAFREWSKAAGEDVMTKTAFGKKMAERGFDGKKQGGIRGRGGIALAGVDT